MNGNDERSYRQRLQDKERMIAEGVPWALDNCPMCGYYLICECESDE